MIVSIKRMLMITGSHNRRASERNLKKSGRRFSDEITLKGKTWSPVPIQSEPIVF